MLVNTDILDQYQALIFDMDGTIIDTMPSHAKAWEITGEHADGTVGRSGSNET
ncbi:hypothetical protein HMPREF0027_1815 [Actinobacillus ureae ATCC 25976]|uniref:Uncharacterized protein n=1 Tax=Actinobacillus ureae ATCC 25976 TaxID=887324 RepID=E8KIZ8_9PAST|nr:hypothetical protein HMPREF0027_1815 [Actinobacillus ureae ATCC 25976]